VREKWREGERQAVEKKNESILEIMRRGEKKCERMGDEIKL
jgi:hypothetical protein